MKRSGAFKFPNSVQLFRFCQKVLMQQRGTKIHDQEVGAILNFNPSDCSHWKRGEKNVRSVFALAKLSSAIGIEATLVHDVASGAVDLDEAFFEFQESKSFASTVENAYKQGGEAVNSTRANVENFVNKIHETVDLSTPPVYLPEILRFFSFIKTQPIDRVDKLSRILRVKPGTYLIHFRKGDLKPQTRMSIVKNLSRIVFEGERGRFPELGPANESLIAFEETLFTVSLLAPKASLLEEMAKLDSRRNVISELASLFWVPKSLIGFQLQDILRSGARPATRPIHQSPISTQDSAIIPGQIA